MVQEHHITFGPFRLETTRARLWRGEQAITLRPRTCSVLRYLVEHPGRLVTKAELLQHVWAGTHVTDTVLRVCIREMRAVAEALTLVEATEERWWEAEVCRLKGELLLRLPLPDISQATACLHRALDVARHQQARALELRAALSLSRLWQQQDKRDQARQLLIEIYGWFTEGFTTPDLHEVRMWLEAR